MLHQYMVEFDLPDVMTEEFAALVPQQRSRVNRWMERGVITSYSLSADFKRLWAIVIAKSEEDVTQVMRSLPLTKYMEFTTHQLMFHNSLAMALPAISMN